MYCQNCVEHKWRSDRAPKPVLTLLIAWLWVALFGLFGYVVVQLGDIPSIIIGSLILLVGVFILSFAGKYSYLNLIGWAVYLFLDESGIFHVHRNNPTDPKRSDAWWYSDEGRKNQVIKTRIGGLLRTKGRVFTSTKRSPWKVAHSWNNLDDLVLKDGHGIWLCLPADELLKTINDHQYVIDFITRKNTTETARDKLFLNNDIAVEEIQAMKEKGGRSPYSQLIRECLEESTKLIENLESRGFPFHSNDEIRYLWRDRIRAFLKERRINHPSVAVNKS